MSEDRQLEQIDTNSESVNDFSLDEAIVRLEDHLANPVRYTRLTREQAFQLGTTLASFAAVVAIYLLTSENPVATVFPAIFSTLQIRRSFEVLGQLFGNGLIYLNDRREFEIGKQKLLIDVFHAAHPDIKGLPSTVPRELEGKAGILAYLIAANVDAGLEFIAFPRDGKIPEYIDAKTLLEHLCDYRQLATRLRLGERSFLLLSYDLPIITSEEYEALRLYLLRLKENIDPDEDWFVIYDHEEDRYQLLCGLGVYTDDNTIFNDLKERLTTLLQTDVLEVLPRLENTGRRLSHYPLKFDALIVDVLRTEKL